MTVQELITTLQNLPINADTAIVYIVNEGEEIEAEEILYDKDSITIDSNY